MMLFASSVSQSSVRSQSFHHTITAGCAQCLRLDALTGPQTLAVDEVTDAVALSTIAQRRSSSETSSKTAACEWLIDVVPHAWACYAS